MLPVSSFVFGHEVVLPTPMHHVNYVAVHLNTQAPASPFQIHSNLLLLHARLASEPSPQVFPCAILSLTVGFLLAHFLSWLTCLIRLLTLCLLLPGFLLFQFMGFFGLLTVCLLLVLPDLFLFLFTGFFGFLTVCLLLVLPDLFLFLFTGFFGFLTVCLLPVLPDLFLFQLAFFFCFLTVCLLFVLPDLFLLQFTGCFGVLTVPCLS